MLIRYYPCNLPNPVLSPCPPRHSHPGASPQTTPHSLSVAGPTCSSEDGSLQEFVQAICVPPLFVQGTAKSSLLEDGRSCSSGVTL